MSVEVQNPSPGLTQLVLKPTVFCYHRCSYCDLRQDYYHDLLASGKDALRLTQKDNAGKRQNPGHMPRDLALRVIDCGRSRY